MRAILFSAAAAVLLSRPAFAATWVVGPGQTYTEPSQVQGIVAAGDTVQILAGAYTDCSTWAQPNLTITGAGIGLTVIGNKVCNQKGVLDVTGSGITVEGMTITGARNPYNAAGIRVEGVTFTMDNVRLTANQNGILANPVPGSTVTITDSYVDANGSCGSTGTNCTHGIYVDQVAKLEVTHSTFCGQLVGHDIKSRAKVTNVLHNWIGTTCPAGTYGAGEVGTESYLIDAPDGGKLTVQYDTFERDATAGNPNAISFGEEEASDGLQWPTAVFHVDNCTIANNTGGTITFANNSSSDPAISAALVGNTSSGSPVTWLVGAGTVQ